ncbi:MAG: TPD domain-containing protein [Gemmatimonadaceae bacterium]
MLIAVLVVITAIAVAFVLIRRQHRRRRITTEGGGGQDKPHTAETAPMAETTPKAEMASPKAETTPKAETASPKVASPKAETTPKAETASPKVASPKVSIDWPTRCYPAELARDAAAAARAARGFGPIDDEERARLTRAARVLGERHKTPAFGYEQLASIRNQEVALRAGHAGARAFREAPALAAESAAGDTVLAIARKHNLPPLAVLRAILIERAYSANRVREMLAAPETLPKEFAAEAPAIFEADLGSRLNNDRVRARSDTFERVIEDKLRGTGAKFKTEGDLRAEGSALTPDFLFGDEPVRINGRVVHWLDAKDYSMYGGRLVAASLRKQAEKYTKAFGPGAMVFRGGVACSCAVPGVLSLDGGGA